MSKYKLLKDLPNLDAGAIFEFSFENNWCHYKAIGKNGKDVTYDQSLVEYAANRCWFELIPDTPAPEQTTKEGFVWTDSLVMELYKAIAAVPYEEFKLSTPERMMQDFKASKQPLSNTPKEKSYYENIETIGKLSSTPKQEQPGKERIELEHLTEASSRNYWWFTLKSGDIPKEKLPLIKEAIETIINH